jgi:hypothetical protein
MNEQLAKLASQAGFDIGIRDGLILGNFSDMHRCEHFAKLIVAECAGIYDAIDNGNLHMGTDNYLEALSKHFGVK